MIRELAIGSIILIAQAVPAFAEIIPLACTDDRAGTTHHIVFDTDARRVSEIDNPLSADISWPMTMTDLQMTWGTQIFHFLGPLYVYWTYDRNSEKLTMDSAQGMGSSSFTYPGSAGSASYTCIGWQKP